MPSGGVALKSANPSSFAGPSYNRRPLLVGHLHLLPFKGQRTKEIVYELCQPHKAGRAIKEGLCKNGIYGHIDYTIRMVNTRKLK